MKGSDYLTFDFSKLNMSNSEILQEEIQRVSLMMEADYLKNNPRQKYSGVVIAFINRDLKNADEAIFKQDQYMIQMYINKLRAYQ